MKIKLHILLFLVHFSISAQDLNESLLLSFSFDANFEDNSGNDFHGTNINSTFVQDRFGLENAAAFFNEDACVELPNSSLLKPDFPFSVAMWFNSDDLASGNINSYSLWASDQKEDSYAGAFLTLLRNSGKLLIGYGADQGCIDVSCRNGAISIDTFESGIWYHIAVNFVSESTFELYVNGCKRELEQSGSGLQTMVYSNVPGAIGKNDHSSILGNPISYYKGAIDDFYFWSRTVGQSDVDELVAGYFSSEIEYVYTTLCAGESVIFNDIEYSEPGEYEIVESNQFGCDSLYVLSIQVEACNDCNISFEEDRVNLLVQKLFDDEFLIKFEGDSFKQINLDDLQSILLTEGVSENVDLKIRSAQTARIQRQLDQLHDMKNNTVISLDLRIQK